MPPDVYALLLSNLQETRREMQEGFRDLRAVVNGYDPKRCEMHTERLTKVASRVDTFEAAQQAVHSERTSSGTWRRSLALVVIAATLAFAGGLASFAAQRALSAGTMAQTQKPCEGATCDRLSTEHSPR